MNELNWTLGGLAPLFALLVLAGRSGAGANAGIGGNTTTVYAGGYSITGAGVKVPGYWFDGVWVGLPSLSSNGGEVLTMVVN